MKILIIKTSSLGDVIQSFPCLQYLRQKFPEAQIDWVVEKGFSELIQGHPAVNRVLCVDTKLWRKGLFKRENRAAMRHFHQALRAVEYDVVFDLQANIKSGLICCLAKAKVKVGFGSSTVHELPNMLFTNRRYNPPKGLNIRSDYLFLAQSYCNDMSGYADAGIRLHLNPEQQDLLHEESKRIQEMPGSKIILETAVGPSKKVQDIELESLVMGAEHSQTVKAAPITSDYGSKDCAFWPAPTAVSRIMVCPGSAWPNKQMTPEGLKELLQQLRKQRSCSFVFVWGTTQEQHYVQALQEQFADCSLVIKRLPLPVLQNLMATMDLVVAMDSLPLHLAGTTQVPTLSIFGASSAAKYKPEGPQHRSYQGPCPYGRTFEKRCPILRTCPTGACIRQLKQPLFKCQDGEDEQL